MIMTISAIAIATIASTPAVGFASSSQSIPSDLAPISPAEAQEVAKAMRRDPRRPVIALALGGGGIRGFAHIGVIQALEEFGLRVEPYERRPQSRGFKFPWPMGTGT